jgi:putative membrane protein
MHYVSVAALQGFVIYMAIGIAMLIVFMFLYMLITPHDDMRAIKMDRTGPTTALVGAMIGFTLPIVSLSYHGSDLLDFIIWGAIAGMLQLILFKVLYWLLPQTSDENNTAIGIVYAGGAISIGLMNAVSLIPN